MSILRAEIKPTASDWEDRNALHKLLDEGKLKDAQYVLTFLQHRNPRVWKGLSSPFTGLVMAIDTGNEGALATFQEEWVRKSRWQSELVERAFNSDAWEQLSLGTEPNFIGRMQLVAESFMASVLQHAAALQSRLPEPTGEIHVLGEFPLEIESDEEEITSGMLRVGVGIFAFTLMEQFNVEINRSVGGWEDLLIAMARFADNNVNPQ